MLRYMLTENGMTPDEFAEHVYAGIAKGDYWLMPQRETIDHQLKQRTEMILARRNPVPLSL